MSRTFRLLRRRLARWWVRLHSGYCSPTLASGEFRGLRLGRETYEVHRDACSVGRLSGYA